MEEIFETKLSQLETEIVDNSYIIDTLLFYCEENSEVDEVSHAASVLKVISGKQKEIFKLILEYRNLLPAK